MNRFHRFARIRTLAQVLAASTVLAGPAVLYAHARLERSSPAANARLAAPPREIRLKFTERPELTFSVVELRDSSGTLVSLGMATRSSADPNEVVFEVNGGMARGKYTAKWKTVAGDGHAINGTFAFAVDGDTAVALAAPVTPTPTVTTPAGAVDPGRGANPAPQLTGDDGSSDSSTAAGRGLRMVELTMLLAVIGVVGFRFFVMPKSGWTEATSADALRSALRLGSLAALLLLAAGVMRLTAQASAVAIPGASGAETIQAILSDTSWGRGWLVGMIGTSACVIGLFVAQRGPLGWTMAGVGSALAAMGPALTGHAMTTPWSPSMAVALDVAHVVGAGLWLGTLGVLVAVAAPAVARVGTSEPSSALLTGVTRSFHRVAIQGSAIVILTGVLNAWMRLGGKIGTLVSTPYGRVLLGKLVFVAVIAILGMYHWRVVDRAEWNDRSTRAFRRTALMELGVAVVVVMLTAILISIPPPAEL